MSTDFNIFMQNTYFCETWLEYFLLDKFGEFHSFVTEKSGYIGLQPNWF